MNENELTKYNISILGEKTVGKASLVSVFLGQGFTFSSFSRKEKKIKNKYF